MCNSRCDYCFYCDETEKRKQESYGFMSEETLKNIIRRTLPRAEGGISYAFQGGEPTLRGLDFFRKVIEFEKSYNKHGIRIQNALQTNGTLLNEEWCDFLAENHFLVGISIDGISETHDKYRHFKGSERSAFEQVIKAAELMDRAGVEYNVLTVVNSATAATIARIYQFYREICGIQYVCEADGSVYPCDFYMLDEYRLGNFNTDRIYSIDSRRMKIGFLEESLKISDECRSCEYGAVCRGGCFRNRDRTQTGSYLNYFCVSYKMFFQACLPRLSEIAKRISQNSEISTET